MEQYIIDQPESKILASQKLEFKCPIYFIYNFTAEAGNVIDNYLTT